MKGQEGEEMRKLTNRISMLLFVAAFIVAGCTPAGQTTTTAETTQTTTGPESTTAPESTPTTSGEAEARDSITIVLPEEPLALDPLLPNSDTLPVTFNLFEPLISLTNEGEIVPQLALVFEQVEPTRWHLELRPDVVFHDGSPFNADVVEHMVIDLQEILVSNGLPFEGMTVEKIDDLTIDFITVQPDPILARLFTLVGVPPIGGPPDPTAPNGTGPYRLVEWTPSSC
jgi:peptide/nickel transport system substrate-binding protein